MSDCIETSVDLNAPVARVWRALTDHGEFGAWFQVKLDGPFVAGERSRGRLTFPGAEHLEWDVTVVALEPERRFAFTWRPFAVDAAYDYAAEPPTTVEFRLEPRDAGSRLTVRECGFDALPEARRASALRANTNGWTTQIQALSAHVGG